MPWTLISNASGVFEQKIGTCGSEADHCPGTRLKPTVTLVSNTVSAKDNLRTIVVTRGFVGANPDYYTFDPAAQATLPFITAVGMGPIFAYHKAHAPAMLSLADAGGKPTCVCDAGANGKMCDVGGTGCNSFVKNCVAPPTGTLLAQRNPTCNSRQYGGGLRCCHHKPVDFLQNTFQIERTALHSYGPDPHSRAVLCDFLTGASCSTRTSRSARSCCATT